MRASDSSSCPEEASASKPAQEGFWFLWDVLSCLSGPGVLSCHVLFCVSSPGGLLIPPDFPREILGEGRRGSGCRGRAEGTEAKAPEDHLPWPPELPAPPWPPELRAPCTAMASRAPSSTMASRAPSSAMVPVCLFHSGGPRPVFLSVFVLRGLQSAHPPSPMELLKGWLTGFFLGLIVFMGCSLACSCLVFFKNALFFT